MGWADDVLIMEHYAGMIDAAIGRLEQAVVGSTAANSGLVKQQFEQSVGQAAYAMKKLFDTAIVEVNAAKQVPPTPTEADHHTPPKQVDHATVAARLLSLCKRADRATVAAWFLGLWALVLIVAAAIFFFTQRR